MVSNLDRRIKEEIKFQKIEEPETGKSVIYFDNDQDADQLYTRLMSCPALKGKLCCTTFRKLTVSADRTCPSRVVLCSMTDKITNPWKFAKNRLYKKVCFADDRQEENTLQAKSEEKNNLTVATKVKTSTIFKFGSFE